jgi:tRNA threonylcarbamoyladenosine biosynthesis protein TsaB
MIDGLMANAGLRPQQLDALAFGCGPGSFTGVRIATGVVHGIAFGADLPIVPVSTLAAIAQDYFDNHTGDIALTAMDARMGEIFWGVYQRNLLGFAELWAKERVCPAQEVALPQATGVGVGSAWAVYQADLKQRLGILLSHSLTGSAWPRAGAVVKLGAEGARLGKAVPVELAMPVYLRDKVAQKESERKKL